MAYLTRERFKQIISDNDDVDIFTFISDRKGRKTSTVQIELIERALKHNRPFVVIRSKKDERISASWLSEYAQSYFNKNGVKFITEKIDSNIVKVSAITKDEKKEKIIYYGVWLSLAEKYKSNYFKGFNRVEFIIWEECIPNKPIPQNIQNVRKYHTQTLVDILSIGSTIARDNRVRYIFLGNDISANIINPVTVSFDLLERLEENIEIIDYTEIDDREYKYYFNYFDFPGAVNHWLFNRDALVSRTVDMRDAESFTYIIKSKYRTYYLYRIEQFYYISSIHPKNKVDFINSIKDFFQYYDRIDLYERYKDDISVALMILYSYEKNLQEPINRYFGSPDEPHFRKCRESFENSIINLYEFQHMTYYEILKLKNIDDIRNFVAILKKAPVLFENVQIKLLCDELKNKMFFDDIT